MYNRTLSAAQVWALYSNRSDVIVANELRPGQVDPFDYSVVGPRMEERVLAQRSDAALRRSEHKRWQMGVLKVSRTAFGSGRLIPITRR